MSFFISDAVAASTQAINEPQAGGLSMLFMPLVFLVIFYFMLWRPQSKRAKEQREMISGIQKGDEVVTAGGILGKVTHLSDNYLSVDIAEGTIIKIQRQSVSAILPKGTIKSI